MGFGNLLGTWLNSAYSYSDNDEFDMESFILWLEADDVTREKMELKMTEEGKIAFREKEKSLGFFK